MDTLGFADLSAAMAYAPADVVVGLVCQANKKS